MWASYTNEFACFAEELADAARAVALKHFRNLGAIDYKEDGSPVTPADRETEAVIRQMIGERYPTHGVVGEEHGHMPSESPWLWAIDPIDGTRSFITGRPTFGCLIALLFEHQPVIGVIDMPALDERWLGITDKPSTHNGRQCQSNSRRLLKESTVFATSIDMFNDNERKQFDRLSAEARFRNFGADCYAYGLLASGYADIVMESDMSIHDFLALVPVIEGSGGCITDWHGKPLNFLSGNQVLATANSSLHKQCLSIIVNAV
jgi:histidinol phosphatase-like enzyme (inositol monophosphatase family)